MGARKRFFEEVDAVGRPIAFAAHRGARFREHDLAAPPVAEHRLHTQRGAAPARWPGGRRPNTGNNRDLLRQNYCLRADHRFRRLARVTTTIISSM